MKYAQWEDPHRQTWATVRGLQGRRWYGLIGRLPPPAAPSAKCVSSGFPVPERSVLSKESEKLYAASEVGLENGFVF